MSDIAIRFDGLILAGTLLIAAAVFLLLASGAALAAWRDQAGRARWFKAVRSAMSYALLNACGLIATCAYMAFSSPPAAGPDWIDWLTLPVVLLFAAGCASLIRSKPRSA